MLHGMFTTCIHIMSSMYIQYLVMQLYGKKANANFVILYNIKAELE